MICVLIINYDQHGSFRRNGIQSRGVNGFGVGKGMTTSSEEVEKRNIL